MAKSFEDRDGWIWMNGEFIPWKDATSHIISQGLHYASAVFEGERAYNGNIFKSEEHTKRLFKSAEIIGIEIPYTEEQINNAKKELIKKMNYKDCYVRPLAWRGGDQMGISTTKSNINVAIAVWDDWASYFKIEDRKAGLKLITSPIVSDAIIKGFKSGVFLSSIGVGTVTIKTSADFNLSLLDVKIITEFSKSSLLISSVLSYPEDNSESLSKEMSNPIRFLLVLFLDNLHSLLLEIPIDKGKPTYPSPIIATVQL